MFSSHGALLCPRGKILTHVRLSCSSRYLRTHLFSQVLLINAVKDVAAALGDLISATKNASGKPAQDPAMSTLKDSAKVGISTPSAADVGVGFA